jgi:S1-C subfamily serine protease
MGSDLPTGVGMEFDGQAFVKMDLTQWNSKVVPIVVIDPDRIRCVGTAFNISPDGVWITARHVIDWAIEIVTNTPDAYIAVLWVGSGGAEDVPDLLGGPIHVAQIAKDDANGSDLALLQAGLLRAGEPYYTPHVRLSARIPKKGTHILGLGYALFDVESDISNLDAREVLIEPNFHASTGEITQVYPQGRDTFKDLDGNYMGKLPTACFETSARFDAGMSGGPVFDDAGSVCGVIASGIEQGADAERHTSFASATPYIYLLGLPDGDRIMRIYEMVQRNLVDADAHFERFTLSEHDGVVDISFPVERE